MSLRCYMHEALHPLPRIALSACFMQFFAVRDQVQRKAGNAGTDGGVVTFAMRCPVPLPCGPSLGAPRILHHMHVNTS